MNRYSDCNSVHGVGPIGGECANVDEAAGGGGGQLGHYSVFSTLFSTLIELKIIDIHLFLLWKFHNITKSSWDCPTF